MSNDGEKSSKVAMARTCIGDCESSHDPRILVYLGECWVIGVSDRAILTFSKVFPFQSGFFFANKPAKCPGPRFRGFIFGIMGANAFGPIE